MATLMKGISGNRAKIGVAEGASGEQGLIDHHNETSDAEPTSAPPGASFEEESAPKKPAGGGAVASTVNQVGEKLKGQAVTSGGPDMERILRQGFIRKV